MRILEFKWLKINNTINHYNIVIVPELYFKQFQVLSRNTNCLLRLNKYRDKYFLALDPAQPNFKDSQKNERVDVDSGQFVMVLHTSTMFLGLREPVGHVDFYFNGGQMQPSCNSDTGKYNKMHNILFQSKIAICQVMPTLITVIHST